MGEEKEIPKGWELAKLAALVADPKKDLVDGPFGSNLKANEYVESGVPVFKIQNIKANKFIDSKINYIKEEKSKVLSRHSFVSGDLIITKLGDPLGLCCKVPENYRFGIIVADLMRLRPNRSVVHDQYLIYAINSRSVQDQFKAITKGTTRPRVNLSIVREIEIPLPPLPEQHRIVAKIEELFSSLDKGIESLKTAQQQLKVYRQAVLKWAFEGKLTAKWLDENKGNIVSADILLKSLQAEREKHYQQQLVDWQKAKDEWETSGKNNKKPAKPTPPKQLPLLTNEELAKLPELPQGWVWSRAEDLCSPDKHSIGIGPFGSNLKVSDYRDRGTPLIFVKNITRSNFRLDLKYIDDAKYQELLPHTVRALDLLITKMGDPPGDCDIYPANVPIAVLTADCLKIRIWGEFLERKFFKFYINSQSAKKQLGLITSGVAQKKISVDRFKTICFPLPSREEQKQVLQEIESRLSVCDKIEDSIEQSLKQAESLRQSILKKAFEGKLVPQDPNDEPASLLLARIKSERESIKMETPHPFKTRKKI